MLNTRNKRLLGIGLADVRYDAGETALCAVHFVLAGLCVAAGASRLALTAGAIGATEALRATGLASGLVARCDAYLDNQLASAVPVSPHMANVVRLTEVFLGGGPGGFDDIAN